MTGARSLLVEGKHLPLFVLCVLALTLVGVAAVYSASFPTCIAKGQWPAYYMVRHLGFSAVGGLVAYVVYRFVPLRIWSGTALWSFWAACMTMLVATIFLGVEALGATRWLPLGPIQFQPSELAKIAILLVTAKFCQDWKYGKLSGTSAATCLAIFAGIPIVVILLTQSDLGTTIICTVGVLSILWLVGVPKRIVAGLLVFCFVAGMIAILSTPYRAERFWLLLNPYNDGENGQGAGYQVIQSQRALASGGLTGVGIGGSKQKYGYLPECHTDFVFAIIGEETGLVGCLAVIGLFLILLYLGLQISEHAVSEQGRLVAGGLSIMLVFQAFLNIACVIGLFPLTGKPLPFISYGGTSLLVTFLMVGLVLSVTRESGQNEAEVEKRRREMRITKIRERRG